MVDRQMTARPSDVIVSEIERIDVRLFDVRFNCKDLSQDQILAQLTELIEQRNQLTDELQNARKNEFKEFIDDLNLKDIDITPFYIASRRAKLSLGNSAAAQLAKTTGGQTGGDPWRNMLRSFMSKSKSSEAHGIPADLLQQRQRIVDKRKSVIEPQLAILARKPMLSPTDVASKCRLEGEAAILAKYDVKAKKK